MPGDRICVLGGSGFIGRHLANELTQRGYRLRVLTRRRARHRELLVLPDLELLETDLHDGAAMRSALAGCAAAINLTGILNTGPGQNADFDAVHARLPARLVETCATVGVPRVLHMSALGAAAEAPSEYLRSKHAGEEAAHAGAAAGLQVTSFRPCVVFGPDDSFFNRFAALLRIAPGVFPLACPEARFAPVYVGDVVRAMADTLDLRSSFDQRYSLCGPREYTLRELVRYTAKCIGRKRLVIGLGPRLSMLQARILEHLPGKPFSRDNYRSLQVESVCRGTNGLQTLCVAPTALETIVPEYLGHHDHATTLSMLRSKRTGAG